ncbi:lysophospholipid acyltransferase family protein [Protaetiibacter mangrovi]|uniref:1-acyl-sn-glycerol-3-phosphate acyltransferase n=1 Tax=Protaetiibacter mangrovi TaxID=2970926 RepID=A0ABT1ZI16_9MICO|nr:lysophospholipid acyltransferase family protein [Protaetiibacter mangrovi]MCS0500359.1 1-acyl-sn-glycerol-3-phosphate acyltransferase [Protaetiibacter mangrovi]TPX05330.1 1-acyl-sn-glycerol-3-phosphate acyltransferase [Schumannella luteola]
MGAADAPARRKREKTLGWRVLAAVLIPPLLAVGRYRIRHGERLPREGAFVLSPNHYSNLDPVTTGYIVWKLGRVPRFLAKASVFRVPVVGAILRATGQIPVERQGTGGSKQSLAAASNLVDDGLAVIIYPEGTLTREPDLWPMRGKSGAVRMALEHDVPLIPMAHWGVQQILPRYSKKVSLFPRKDVEAIIGEPVDLSRWRGKPITHELLAEATEAVMVDITALLVELRGGTPPLERWDPSAHGQSEIGRFEQS